MNQEILHIICERRKNGEKAALITIVETRGSTPRKAGSRMLILPGGQSYGTIGGGCGEADVRRQALIALDDEMSQMFTVSMTNKAAADEGMVCGGTMEVFIQIV